jgi:hypothetical protein
MVVMSLGMIVLIGFAALAIDGGRVFTLQRHAQNAADSAALAAARVKCSGGDVVATALAWAAQNGYDNDGVTNTVTVSNPPSTGTHAGDLAYVEVIITAEIPKGMAHVVFGGPLQVTVGAMGHCGGDSIFDDVNDTLLAFGPCPDIKAIDVSGTNSEIIGGVYSNDDIYISGSTNHFHGTVTSLEGTTLSGSDTVFEPGSPAPGTTPLANPLASLTTSMYAPGGARVQGLTVYDLSNPTGGKVDVGRLSALGLYDPITRQLEPGVYYAGPWDIELSDSPMYGTVTLVTEGHIKSSGSAINLTAYVDGLLMFSNKQPAESCKDWVIDVGGSGTY